MIKFYFFIVHRYFFAVPDLCHDETHRLTFWHVHASVQVLNEHISSPSIMSSILPFLVMFVMVLLSVPTNLPMYVSNHASEN